MHTIIRFHLHCTGTADLINSHPDIVAVSEVEDSQIELCRKDTGSAHKLRRWSRGHQFIVRGGGHIESWQPLFKYVVQFIFLSAQCYTIVMIMQDRVTLPGATNITAMASQ